ncbi:MAG: hypothetical protein ACFCUU_18465 [Cyclobacteriaceae bacterium]
MKQVLLIIMLAAATFSVYGQSNSKACCANNPGCEPSACGPSGTKVEESKAVSELRTKLQLQLQRLEKSSYIANSEFQKYEIPKGNNDDESLVIIMQTINAIKAELLRNVPQDRIILDKNNTLTALPESKRHAMIYLNNETQLLTEQIQKL